MNAPRFWNRARRAGEDRLPDAGDRGEELRAVAAQVLLEAPLVGVDHVAAERERAQFHREFERVPARQDRQEAIARFHVDQRRQDADVVGDVAVLQHHALRLAGGARRVQQERQVVFGGALRVPGERGRVDVLRSWEVLAVHVDHAVAAVVAAFAEDHLRFGVLEDVRELLIGDVHAARHRDRAGREDAAESVQPARAVLGNQRDAVARLDAQLCEPKRHAVNRTCTLRVRPTLIPARQHGLIGVRLKGREEVAVDGFQSVRRLVGSEAGVRAWGPLAAPGILPVFPGECHEPDGPQRRQLPG